MSGRPNPLRLVYSAAAGRQLLNLAPILAYGRGVTRDLSPKKRPKKEEAPPQGGASRSTQLIQRSIARAADLRTILLRQRTSGRRGSGRDARRRRVVAANPGHVTVGARARRHD